MGSASRVVIAVLPIAFLAGHALTLLLRPAIAHPLSFGWLIAGSLLAAISCMWRGHRSGAEGWAALGCAVLLWTAGMVNSTISAIVLRIDTDNQVGMALFALYGVPFIFALVSHEADRRSMRLVDAILAAALGYLFCVYIDRFSTASGTQPADIDNLRLVFDVENIYIMVFAAVRLISCAPVRSDFFRCATVFAVAYAASAGYINHFEPETDFGRWSDLVIDVPFLLLIWMTLRAREKLPERIIPRRPDLARVVRAASPMLLPVTLLTVSVLLEPFAPIIAVLGCIIASLGYGTRTVLMQVRSLQEHDELSLLSRVDALTGIPNRRRFDEALQREWARRGLAKERLVLLMIDIDYFKPLNDQYGHAVGDEVLRRVARALAGCARSDTDMVARYGGEEFVVVLPDTSVESANEIAERMRTAVEGVSCLDSGGQGVTISIGLAGVEEEDSEVQALVRAADGALYEAKRGGRNRVAHRTAAHVVPLRPERSRDGRAA